MTPADLAAAHALDERSFSSPWSLNNYRFEVHDNQAGLPLVAQDAAGEIIGVLVLWLIVDEAHVATIAVDERCRRQGIARDLLCAGLRMLADQGAVSATLEVRESNLPAQALYHGFGFEVVARRKRYYRDNNEDALLMTAHDLSQILRQCASQP
jgi:ribosomal-protein-alanine N-acetyltransferase